MGVQGEWSNVRAPAQEELHRSCLNPPRGVIFLNLHWGKGTTPAAVEADEVRLLHLSVTELGRHMVTSCMEPTDGFRCIWEVFHRQNPPDRTTSSWGAGQGSSQGEVCPATPALLAGPSMCPFRLTRC